MQEECLICYLNVNVTFNSCCLKPICIYCTEQIGDLCPFCRISKNKLKKEEEEFLFFVDKQKKKKNRKDKVILNGISLMSWLI